MQILLQICQIITQGLLVYSLVAHFMKYTVVETDSATEGGAQFISGPTTVTTKQ